MAYPIWKQAVGAFNPRGLPKSGRNEVYDTFKILEGSFQFVLVFALLKHNYRASIQDCVRLDVPFAQNCISLLEKRYVRL